MSHTKYIIKIPYYLTNKCSLIYTNLKLRLTGLPDEIKTTEPHNTEKDWQPLYTDKQPGWMDGWMDGWTQ